MLLTGEPEDVAKSTKVKPRQPGVAEKLTADNMAFSSCNVKAGTAVGIIVATGMRTLPAPSPRCSTTAAATKTPTRRRRLTRTATRSP